MTSSNRTLSSAQIALITIVVYLVSEFSRDALFAIPVYAEMVDNLPRILRWLEQPLRWFIIVLAGLFIAHRLNPVQSLRELALTKPIVPAFVLSLVVTLPMLIPSLIAGHFNPELDPAYVLFTALIWPLAEEIVYRGYVLRQLYRRANWRFWPAAVLSSLLFGLVHLDAQHVMDEGIAVQIGSVAMIAGLSILGAWVFTRWDDNLWVMVFLHGFLNLYWHVFELGDNPLGGLVSNILRLTCAVLAILLTLKRPAVERLLAKYRLAPAAGNS